MILLLDAHALLWWMTDHPTLASPAHAAIDDPGNAVLVSAAVVWELAIKRASGKLGVPADIPSAIERVGFSTLPITLQDAEAAAALPAHHRDPFDRMLVSQAQRVGGVIVTRDSAFASYGVEVLTA
ncbi:MAG: type II toxin-antitoxin system VapC family toxin [Chloroflexi bacterium]|nr:MAG: type II toxin-antitoxin system VapC family toxin [Chloroflexota bacterium]